MNMRSECAHDDGDIDIQIIHQFLRSGTLAYYDSHSSRWTVYASIYHDMISLQQSSNTTDWTEISIVKVFGRARTRSGMRNLPNVEIRGC